MTKLFSLLYQGDVHVTEDQQVIPRELFSELMEISEVLEKAKEDAAAYREAVEQECEILKSEAYEKGFNEGLEKFNTHLIHFDKELQHLRLELQRQILPLALKAARKIVGEQLALKPDAIVEIVLQALSPVIQNHRFTIYVNKADKEVLEANRIRLRDVLAHVQHLVIHERADVTAGGCVIETESGIINASIENQWRALESAFEKYMKK